MMLGMQEHLEHRFAEGVDTSRLFRLLFEERRPRHADLAVEILCADALGEREDAATPIQTKDGKQFVGPGQAVCFNVPTPTAHMRKALRFGSELGSSSLREIAWPQDALPAGAFFRSPPIGIPFV